MGWVVGAVVQESERAQRRIANAMTQRCDGEWEEGAEGKCLRLRATMPPVSCEGIGQPVRKDLPRGAAVSPDSYRGWSRQHMARIRAQREPIVSPAGTGADYRGPEGPASVAIGSSS